MRADWYKRLLKHPKLLSEPQRNAAGGAQILAVLEQYRVTEQLDPAELDLQQRTLLLALAQHAAAQSPQFAGRLAKARLTPAMLAQPGGLSALAPLTRGELVASKAELFCRSSPAAHGAVTHTSTSGSTGEPVTVRRTALCGLHWMAHTLREHLWHDRDFSARLAVIRANAAGLTRQADWGTPAARLLRTGPALAMAVSLPIDELLKQLIDFRPGYLLVLPGILAGLLDVIERSGRRWDGLLGIRTLSETVPPALRAQTLRLLGHTINDVYSSQEGGVMATQCPEEGNYHVAETILLEVVDEAGNPCAPGQTGRILITDLINFATPLIRYEIGDYAQAGAPCGCGRGLPVIRRFMGRERNLVILPDGSRHWPVVGFQRWNEIYPIRQFQFTQLDRHTIEARFCANGQPTREQEAELTAIITHELGYPFEIRYLWQEQALARSPGGKFEEFVSLAR